MPIQENIDKFIAEVQNVVNEHYATNFPNLKVPTVERNGNGRKFQRIVCNGSCWGFIALVDSPKLGAKVGDLLFSAGWKGPAKHPRGSILDGTAKYTPYGPIYLK